MAPNYPQRVQQAHNKLKTKAENTQNSWQDTVSERFFTGYMNRFHEDSNRYIQELNSTLAIIDNCEREMDALL